MILQTNQGPKDMTMRSVVGKKARLGRDVSSSIVKIPKGTLVTLTGTYRSGFNISGEKCEHCGITPYVLKVPREWLEVQL